MAQMCPRCEAKNWDGSTYCVGCGLAAVGVEEGSPLAVAATRREADWLRKGRNQRIAAGFDEGLWRGTVPPPPELPEGAKRMAAVQHPAAPLARVPSCIVVGGSGTAVPVGLACEIWGHEATLEIRASTRSVAHFELTEVRSLTVGGPGEVVSGGGFSGGGLGPGGIAEGVLIGAALNALSTRRSIITEIHLELAAGELFFMQDSRSPDEVRRSLSPVFVRLQPISVMSSAPTQPSASEARTDRLIRLSELVTAGLLTTEEFQDLKRELLRDT